MRWWFMIVAVMPIAGTSFAAEPKPPIQVQMDVYVLKGKASLLDRAEVKELLPKQVRDDCQQSRFRCELIPAAIEPKLIYACQEKCGAKVLAEPKLVTLSGRPAHFLAGGQQAVLVPAGGIGNQEVTFRDIGTDLECLPIAMPGDRIYLELNVRVRSVNPSMGTPQMPALDEQVVRSAVELTSDQALLMCQGSSNDRVDVYIVMPHILDAEAPAAVSTKTKSPVEERAAKMAAKLVKKYHEACASGEPEKARKYARQALDLDPECFAKALANDEEHALMDAKHDLMEMLNDSENLRQVREEWRKVWMNDQPSHLTPERVHGGIK